MGALRLDRKRCLYCGVAVRCKLKLWLPAAPYGCYSIGKNVIWWDGAGWG